MQFQVRPLERNVSPDVALQRECVRVMFIDNNSAAGSQKACMHRPGWRRAHASSTGIKSLRSGHGFASVS